MVKDNEKGKKVLEYPKELDDEIFFANLVEEYRYFENRMEAISKYSSEFFQERAKAELVNRYIRALASLNDDYECSEIRYIYLDFLTQLGMDDYCIEAEVENYKLTHSIPSNNIIISKTARK